MVWVPDLALTPRRPGARYGAAAGRSLGRGRGPAGRGRPGDAAPEAGAPRRTGRGRSRSRRAGGTRSLGARLVATSVMVWNPFVVERLVIGHWPVLVGYAVLPWLLLACAPWRRPARAARARCPLLLLLGRLSASTGLATAIAALAGGWRRGEASAQRAARRAERGANLPWLVAGLLHAARRHLRAAGARVFAASERGPAAGAARRPVPGRDLERRGRCRRRAGLRWPSCRW